MKILFYIFLFTSISSCGFFSEKETNKDRAKALLSEIESRQLELTPKIERLSLFGRTMPEREMSKADIELTAIGYTVDDFYKNWTKSFENYKKQEIYMNYDLQLKRLEDFEKVLDKINELVLKADSLTALK